MFKNFFKKIGNFFGDIIGGIGDAIGGIVSGVVKLVTNVVDGFLGAFGFSFDLPEYDSPTAFQNENQGILLNTQSAVKGIPVIYGKRQAGGTRVYMGTGGDNNKYLYVILAVAEGEIDGYTKVFINDEEQKLLDSGNSAMPVFTGNDTITQEKDLTLSSKTPSGEASSYFKDGRSLATIALYTGRENQNANSLFVNAAPGWNQNGRLRGVAYIAARFEFLTGALAGQNPWSGVPEIRVELRGKKVLKTYTSANDTNTDTSTYEAQSVATGVNAFAFSQNPADCLLDYLRNPRYGKGLKDNRINFASFDTQQAIFEQSFTLQNNPLVVSFLFRCDAVLNTEDTLFNNTKRLLQSCRSFLPYINGKYELRVEANVAANDVIEITDDMIIGDINIQSEDKNAKYNEAQVTYANEDKNYDSDTVIFQNATHIATDGEPLILSTSHPTLTNYNRVLQYAKYLVERSRNQLAVSVKVTNEGQSIVSGDVVKINHQYKTTTTGTNMTDFLFKAPTFSDVTQDGTAPEMLFRVVSTKLNYDNTVDLQLLEHRNAVFNISQVDQDLPPQCPPNYTFVPGVGCVFNGGGGDPQCPPGQVWDPNKQNDDGTIGSCVPENPNQCPEGFQFNPATGQCEKIDIEDKVVRVTAFQNNGIGFVRFEVDATPLQNSDVSRIQIQLTTYSNGQFQEIISSSGADAPGTLNRTYNQHFRTGLLKPGDTVYYMVFMIPNFQTGGNIVRLDREGEETSGIFSQITVPYGDRSVILAAPTGGGFTAPQAVDAGGNPVSVDEFNNNTATGGFE